MQLVLISKKQEMFHFCIPTSKRKTDIKDPFRCQMSMACIGKTTADVITRKVIKDRRTLLFSLKKLLH